MQRSTTPADEALADASQIDSVHATKRARHQRRAAPYAAFVDGPGNYPTAAHESYTLARPSLKMRLSTLDPDMLADVSQIARLPPKERAKLSQRAQHYSEANAMQQPPNKRKYEEAEDSNVPPTKRARHQEASVTASTKTASPCDASASGLRESSRVPTPEYREVENGFSSRSSGNKVLDDLLKRIKSRRSRPVEKSIPKQTLRHVANYISHASENPLTSVQISKIVRDEGDGLFSKRSILEWCYDDRTPEVKIQGGVFTKLPDELLFMIIPYLKPADAVCLALSSRELYAKLDYQAVDLRNAGAAIEYSDVLLDHDIHAVVSQQRFEIADRLDRDRIDKLIALENEGKSQGGRYAGCLACSVCHSLHQDHRFSSVQQRSRADGRVCLAASAKFRVCDHLTMDILDMRAQLRKSECDAKYDGKDILCNHKDHSKARGNPHGHAPDVSGFKGVVMASRKYSLIGDDTHSLPSAGVSTSKVLQKMQQSGSGRVCEHVKLGDQVVMEAFRKEEEVLDGTAYVDWAEGECDICGTQWQFDETVDFNRIRMNHAQHPRVLELHVTAAFMKMRDVWSDEWLNNVEDGPALKALRDKSTGSNEHGALTTIVLGNKVDWAMARLKRKPS